MLGTIVNSVAILVGSITGLIFKKSIKKEITDQILQAVGVVVLLVGLAGALKVILVIDQGKISTQHELLVLVTIVLGTLIGEIIQIEQRFTTWGNRLEAKFQVTSFSSGFINATLIFCVGAMAIVGSVESAKGNHEVLFLKAGLDAVTACVLTTTLGWGVIFSSLSVFVYQGFITVLSYFAYDFLMLPDFHQAFSLVGYVLVICIGWNFISSNKIRVANMIPALLVVIIYYLF